MPAEKGVVCGLLSARRDWTASVGEGGLGLNGWSLLSAPSVNEGSVSVIGVDWVPARWGSNGLLLMLRARQDSEDSMSVVELLTRVARARQDSEDSMSVVELLTKGLNVGLMLTMWCSASSIGEGECKVGLSLLLAKQNLDWVPSDGVIESGVVLSSLLLLRQDTGSAPSNGEIGNGVASLSLRLSRQDAGLVPSNGEVENVVVLSKSLQLAGQDAGSVPSKTKRRKSRSAIPRAKRRGKLNWLG